MSNIETLEDVNEPTEYMLTTVDNPFNPFTRFEEWLQFDMISGYNTLSFLDRIVKTSYELSEPDQELAIQHAIDEIVTENVSGVWRKVTRESFNELQKE